MANPKAGLKDVDDIVIGEELASRTPHASQQNLFGQEIIS
jgi:hypothetical protein